MHSGPDGVPSGEYLSDGWSRFPGVSGDRAAKELAPMDVGSVQARRSREFALTWVVIAVALGGGLVAERGLGNGADGDAPIRERTGFVYDVAQPAPSISGVVNGKRTAVLFARPAQVQAVCRWAAGTPIQGVTMVVVAQQQAPCPGA